MPFPQNHSYYEVDVSECADVEKLFMRLINKYDHIDGLINCAGSFGEIGKLEEIHPSSFLKTIEENLIGPYNMCYFGIHLFSKAKRAKIINFSGGGATAVFPYYSGYACSKTALVKLTENLAAEYPSLDINVIAPGSIKTRMADHTLKAGEKAGTFFHKTKEMLEKGGQTLKNVNTLIYFLLSADSDGVSGRFISAQWDLWNTQSFLNELKQNPNFCTLRRIDNKYFKSTERFL